MASTGVGVLESDLVMGVEAGMGIGTAVSLGVMMSSSVDAASFAWLGWLQCTQQQSL